MRDGDFVPWDEYRAPNASRDKMLPDEMIRELRKTAINCAPSLHRLLEAAADQLEELTKETPCTYCQVWDCENCEYAMHGVIDDDHNGTD